MFGGMMSDKASTAKLLASGNASVDAVLARLDLADHISNNCHSGANLRYFMQFTEKNLPRILTAVQKPAGGPSAGITASASVPINTPSSRYYDGNDPAQNSALLAARNASALLVKYCQCCTKASSANNANAVDAAGNPISSSAKNLTAMTTPQPPSPLGKVVPVMIGVFSRRGDLPETVALDVQRILLASIETDHETTLHNINITLRSDIVTGVVRHLSTSMIVSETLVSLFGSALNAKAMMVEVADPSAFVTKWIEHDFHIRLVNHLHSAMKNIDCAPYFFFFQEMLKRAFSPNVGPMVDRILMEECFGKLFDISVTAAEELLKVRKSIGARGTHNPTPRPNGNEETKLNEDSEGIDGESPPVTSINGAVASPTSEGPLDDADYPYLSEALNLVFQCIGIIRRSLPPPESEAVYMSRRLPLAHGPVHVMLRYLPRLVKVLRSGIPSEFRPSTYVVRRHRTAVEKLRKQREEAGDSTDAVKLRANGTLISPATDAAGEDEDIVRVGDDDDEPKKADETEEQKASAKECKPAMVNALSFGSARLAITDILVELTLFRSRVCDEAMVASGAIEALLDCAEIFSNHDLLLRNVHRVVMAVMQRPAYSAISLASNITAAIAASEAAQKTMAQQAGAIGIGVSTVGGDKNGLGGNLSFASNTFENGQDTHPSFLGFDDFKRQYSSSSLCEGDDDSYANTMTSLDDELLFRGSMSAFNGASGSVAVGGSETGGDTTVTDTEGDDESNTASAAGRKASGNGRRRHPHLLPKERREALEAEKQMERQILSRLDRETLTMVHIDPLLRFLIQKRPLSELLYAWATTPEAMSAEEQTMMPEGQRAFKDFSNTSLQVHATQMIHRLKEVGASHTIKSECNETLHCNDEISSKLLLWQRPITGDRFTERGSGCLEPIVHRPAVFHRESDSSVVHDDEEDDNGMTGHGSEGRDNTFDFDADSLLTGRSRASNNSDLLRMPTNTAESPDKKSTSSDDFQNEDVTGEAAMLISPRKRSNSIGREHRYAAAYEAEEDIGNTSSGGLFTDDIANFGASLLRDESGNTGAASASHRDPFSDLGSQDEKPSPVVTRPRSRNSSAPPDPPTAVEVFDENAFETRVLEDLSESENQNTGETEGGNAETEAAAPSSPPHYDRYLDDIPEYKPSVESNEDPIETDDDGTHTFPVLEASPVHPKPENLPSSKFTVKFAAGGPTGSRRSNSVTRQSPQGTASTQQQAEDDSFELDEDAIGIIEKTRGVSVDSSFDSDTAEFLSGNPETAETEETTTTEEDQQQNTEPTLGADSEHVEASADAKGTELDEENASGEAHTNEENGTQNVTNTESAKKTPATGSMYHQGDSSEEEESFEGEVEEEEETE